ncbi:unnamed protein product [Sphagnum compactum]
MWQNNLEILGDRQTGQDVRTQNGGGRSLRQCSAFLLCYETFWLFLFLFALLWLILRDFTVCVPGLDVNNAVMTCQAIANIVKSSLGPVGLDKMLVDDIGDVTITNDGATFLKMLEVEHPAAELAMQEACKYIDDKVAIKVVDAILAVKTTNDKGEIKYPIKAISILKAHGKSAKESYLLNGYALNTGRDAQGMLKHVAPARIACLDVNLQQTKMQMGIQVLYFGEANAIVVRRVSKEDMRHIAKATGATQHRYLTADIEGGETFDAALLGSAEEVVEERVADDDVILKGAKSSRAVSILLRGANDYMLDEMERSIHDSFSIVKWTLESNMVVAGGGAAEAALSVYLENLATTLGSREQLAVVEFALALIIIPKVLAVNAAKDATELVAKLCAYYHNAQTKADKQHLSGSEVGTDDAIDPLTRGQLFSKIKFNDE